MPLECVIGRKREKKKKKRKPCQIIEKILSASTLRKGKKISFAILMVLLLHLIFVVVPSSFS